VIHPARESLVAIGLRSAVLSVRSWWPKQIKTVLPSVRGGQVYGYSSKF
jgi:hypothetical protein